MKTNDSMKPECFAPDKAKYTKRVMTRLAAVIIISERKEEFSTPSLTDRKGTIVVIRVWNLPMNIVLLPVWTLDPGEVVPISDLMQTIGNQPPASHPATNLLSTPILRVGYNL